jgi:hypothetical protein
MAAPRRARLEIIFSIIPAILGLVTAFAALVANAGEVFDKVREALGRNPLLSGVAVTYVGVVVGVLTVALFLLVRSAERRTNRSIEQTRDAIGPEGPAEAGQGTPLSPTEIAARERERNFGRAQIAFSRTRRRMVDETERMQRNSLLNLVIGILFSAIALGILGYPLFSPVEPLNGGWIELVERFAPRFSVGVLVQVIGFFFLRLYVAGEREIHYLRNELTNWEARLIAYSAALAIADKAATRDNIKELARLERNFKLKKGERALYETDETYNDMREIISDAVRGVTQKGRKSQAKSKDE